MTTRKTIAARFSRVAGVDSVAGTDSVAGVNRATKPIVGVVPAILRAVKAILVRSGAVV
jgi:hypothetical protein